jgi:DNA-binding MarR family transcriptional regulator
VTDRSLSVEGTPELGARGRVSAMLSEQLGYLLRLAHDRAVRCLQQVFPPGVTPRDYVVLEYVATGRPISQQALCDEMTVNRTIMVKLIDGLEAAGFVERRRDAEDRRRYALALTPAGRSRLGKLRGVATEGDRLLLEPLTAVEAARLQDLLSAMLEPRLGLAPPPELLGHAVFLARKAHIAMAEEGDRLLAPLGLTTRAYVALLVLAKYAPSSQQELADWMNVSGPLMVELIDRLERLEYVRRERRPEDRRAYRLAVTDRGEEALGALVPMANELVAEFSSPIGADGRAALEHLLLKLVGEP